MKPLIYIAGPYTNPDPVENTHKAIRLATALCDSPTFGLHPVVPHLTLLWHAVTPKPLEYWYEHDMHLLHACHAIVRLPGKSTGADAEMEQAAKWGLMRVKFESLPEEAQRQWTT